MTRLAGVVTHLVVQQACSRQPQHSHFLRLLRRVVRFMAAFVLSAAAISRAARYQCASCLPSG